MGAWEEGRKENLRDGQRGEFQSLSLGRGAERSNCYAQARGVYFLGGKNTNRKPVKEEGRRLNVTAGRQCVYDTGTRGTRNQEPSTGDGTECSMKCREGRGECGGT